MDAGTSLLSSAFAGVEPSTYHPFYRYAEYVVRAGIDGVPIVDPPGKFEDAGAHAAGWIEWVIDSAQAAATLLAEYDSKPSSARRAVAGGGQLRGHQARPPELRWRRT